MLQVIVFNRVMDQANKKFVISKVCRFKPKQYLYGTFYKRGSTFYVNRIQEEGQLKDPFRHTETLFKKQQIQQLFDSKSIRKESKDEEDKIQQRRASGSIKNCRVRLQKSPYLSNSVEIQKMLRLMVPVKGPNQSVKLQIKRHNDLNLRNAQIHIMKKSQSLKDRMRAYSSRMGLPENSKIFIMNSRDIHIKNALLNRGWVESADPNSNLFHLKWVYVDSVADYALLQEGQFYNHFRNNQELTNKNELRKNIKKQSVDLRPSFPLSFDLELNDDSQHFRQIYAKFQAFKLLDWIGRSVCDNFPDLSAKVFKRKHYFQNVNRKNIPSEKKLDIVRQLLYIHQINDQKVGKQDWVLFNAFFEVICYFADLISKDRNVFYSIFRMKSNQQRQVSKSMRIVEERLKFNAISIFQKFSPFYVVEIIKLWSHAKTLLADSYGFQNMWIVKPAGVSRGSGIQITNDMAKLFQLRFGKIVQKYIQFPLLLDCGRKFDIRQWILVKSFNPLKVFAFNKCYARFSSVRYTNDKYENMQKHLTNYSQNKQSYFRQKLQLKGQVGKGEQASISAMSEVELEEKIGMRWKGIKEKIFYDILKTINCCKGEVKQRQGCFQVFGFDIILDQGYRPYILQVNMSPACENRQFLGEYLREMSQGLVDMLQGGEPTCWTAMHIQDYQKNAQEQLRLSLLQKSAKVIQRQWKRRRLTIPLATIIS